MIWSEVEQIINSLKFNLYRDRLATCIKYQGSTAEESSLQKLNQGVSRKCAEYHLRGSFFGTFLDKQKSTDKNFVT